MTDFFTRLAQRTLGVAPSVQPLLIPLYAPATDAGDSALLEIAVDEEAQNEHGTARQQTPFSANEPVQPATRSQAVHTGDSLSSPVSLSAHNRGDSLPSPVSLSSQPVRDRDNSLPSPVSLSSQPVRDRDNSLPSPVSLPDPNTLHSDQGIIHHEQREVHIYTESFLTESLNAPTSVAQVPQQVSEVIRQQDDIATAILTKPSVGTHPLLSDQVSFRSDRLSGASRESDVAGRNVQPEAGSGGSVVGRNKRLIAPRSVASGQHANGEKRPSEPLPEKRWQAQGESPPPTQEISANVTPAVQVTIGRIEVHATPAPTRSEPSIGSRPTAPAVMSLDDYLHQRAKGGHR